MPWGKVIGGAAGWALGELPGFALGLAIGQGVDLLAERGASFRTVPAFTAIHRTQWRRDAALPSLVVLVAKLAKADGRVSEEEVNTFLTLQPVPPGQKASMAQLFERAKRSPEGFELHARRLAYLYQEEPVRLRAYFELLIKVAHADGPIHPAQRAMLAKVAHIFGMPTPKWDHEQRIHEESESCWAGSDPDPYAILGLPPDASIAEAKAAWRRLVQAHHPDRIEANGSPDALRAARNRTAEVNAAYHQLAKRLSGGAER